MRKRISGPFVRAALISYADRGLAFLLPLLVLQFLDRSTAYAEIEFIIGIAVVTASFADLGVRIYMLFAFRQEGSADRVIALSKAALGVLLLFQSIAAVIFFLLSALGIGEITLLIALSLCRIAAATAFGIVGRILVLRDRPELSMLLSLLCWFASLPVLLVPASLSDTVFLLLFMSPNIFIMLLVLGWIWRSEGSVSWQPALRFTVQALRWSWPLLLATAINLAVGNFAKIYAFSAMPQADMVQIAFYQRIAMILQVSHAAIMIVLSKKIFIQKGNKIDSGATASYATSMLLTSTLLIGGVSAANIFDLLYVPWALGIAAPIAIYVFFWCVGSYFEAYVNRSGRTRIMLYNSLLSAAIFTFILFLASDITSVLLCVAMAVSSLIYALLTGFAAWSVGRRSG